MTHFYLRVNPSTTVKTVISVSKKVSKKAVVRNQVKRRVRPIITQIKPKLKPAEYLIVAKAGAENLKGKGLESELKTLFKL